MRGRGLICLAIGFAFTTLLSPRLANADGPWKAQIVDAETGQPIPGVVILAYWIQYTGTVGGWAGGEFVACEEAVTDTDGHFVIPAHSSFTLLPWHKIDREFQFFKGGYDGSAWWFRGFNTWGSLPRWEQEARLKAAWKDFAGDGVVIEFKPMKTGADRLRAFEHSYTWNSLVPEKCTKRLREAVDAERARVGLR